MGQLQKKKKKKKTAKFESDSHYHHGPYERLWNFAVLR